MKDYTTYNSFSKLTLLLKVLEGFLRRFLQWSLFLKRTNKGGGGRRVTALQKLAMAKDPPKVGRCSQDLLSRMPRGTLRDYGSVYHSFEIAHHIFLIIGFSWLFLECKSIFAKGVLPWVPEPKNNKKKKIRKERKDLEDSLFSSDQFPFI